VVAGGGPAGAAAACHLARAGRPVTVIERSPAPEHRLCGEFLGGDALRELRQLGVDVPALGGVPIERLRLVRGAAVAECLLPFAASGVSRRVLDAALLEAAGRAGAEIVRGHGVRSVSGRSLEVDGLGPVEADKLVLATGKHDLRGARRTFSGRSDRLVGFKTHGRLAARQHAELSGAVELVLFPDAYVGLQTVGPDTANLCLLAHEARLAAAGGFDGLLAGLCSEAAHLRRRLDGARFWPRPLAIARVPYGFLHRASAQDHPDVFRVGDQMGVIASFTGGGMAIALHTARLAAECLLADGRAEHYHRLAARHLFRPIRLAGALYAAGRVPWMQAGLMGVARHWPASLGWMGGLTRVAGG